MIESVPTGNNPAVKYELRNECRLRLSYLKAVALTVLGLCMLCIIGWAHLRPPSPPVDAKMIFRRKCSGCHGADAKGTDRGPRLAGNAGVRNRSVQQLRDVINKGIPNTGMPAFDLPDQELDALAEFIHSMPALAHGEHREVVEGEEPFPAAGDIDFARIVHPRLGDWITYDGNLSADRYSPLTQIKTSNVSKLKPQWVFTVPLWKNIVPHTSYFIQNYAYFGLETTPLVADGVMYISGPGSVYALDALTGHEFWEYTRKRSPHVVGDAALGTNRGVAVLGDKVFYVTDNAHLIALNRRTGKLVWETVMPDEPQHYGGTVAPLVVKNMVVAGVAGGDWGIRGFVAAFNADTGKRVWRTYTIPASGEPGIETWGPKEPTRGGGATWLTGSYDPETDTLYWPTGNPWPDGDDRERPGDNLHTNSILALDPATGKMKWYYQFTPHDLKDQDANQPPLLVNTEYQGTSRKLMLFANRNGFFYVFDRADGKLLFVKPFVKKLTWASGVGPDGRPELLKEGAISCPETATNWNATAFNPQARLYYVVALEKCTLNPKLEDWKQTPPKEDPGQKYLRAIDIDTGNVVWERLQAGPHDGKRNAGVLATAGGLLFYGDPSGDFEAMDELSGKTLWRFPAGGENKTSPMTYTVGSRQFVAIAIGPNILCFGLPPESKQQ